MQIFPATLILSTAVSLVACSTLSSTPTSSDGSAAAPATPISLPHLSSSEKQKIGREIWKNESGGKLTGLTHWNLGEEFPSMGIGHFIWYPKGFNGRWTESFPLFIRYAQKQGSRGIPNWVIASPHCPWPNRAAFHQDFDAAELTNLRTYLANNITLQTDFIIATSQQALPKIMAAAPAKQRNRIASNYHKVSTTSNGTYALIDYVNFKGDGTNPTERYNQQGWGLMWVLTEMKDTIGGQAAAKEFAEAAKRCLDRRISNAPPARGESRWKQGWHNRCDSYAGPL